MKTTHGKSREHWQHVFDLKMNEERERERDISQSTDGCKNRLCVMDVGQ